MAPERKYVSAIRRGNMNLNDTSCKPRGKLRHYLLTGLKLCLVVGLFWYMVGTGLISPARLKSLFTVELLPAVVAAVLVFIFSNVMVAVRQKILLGTMGIRLSLAQSFYIIYVCSFFNNVLPGGTGGDVSRVYLLGKNCHGPISNIAGFILFDRVMGFAALAGVSAVAVGYTLIWEASRLQPMGSSLLYLVFLACTAPIFFFAVLFFLRLPYFRIPARKLLFWMSKSPWLLNFVRTIESLSRSRDVFVWGLVISLISCVAQIFGVAVLAWYLFGADTVYPAAVTTPILMISSVVPLTPGNIGGTEYLASILWNFFGVKGGATTLASWRLITVSASLFGGILYLFKFRVGERHSGTDGNFPAGSGLVRAPGNRVD